MKITIQKVSALSVCMIMLICLFTCTGINKQSNGLTPGINTETNEDLDFDIIDPTLPEDDTITDAPSSGNTNTEAPTITIPERFRTALQAYNYATNYLNNSTGVLSVITGITDAGITTQSVKGTKIIDKNGNFFLENASKKTSSIGVDFAEQIYIPANKDDIYYKTSSKINEDLSANYDTPEIIYTKEAYAKEFYLMPYDSNYIINQSTIESSRIRYSASDQRYYCSFILNDLAVENYKYKLKKSSTSSSMPTFKTINMEFILDKYGRFLSKSTLDVCSVTIVIGVTITTSIKEIFKSYNNPDLIIERGE